MVDVVTSVVARGFVIADYDTAQFVLSFSEHAPKAKEAKSKLKQGVDQINATLESLKSKGLTWGKTTFRTGVAIAPHYVYNEVLRKNDLDGQQATYTVTFQTQNMDLVNETYDVLSELDLNELMVATPVYSVRAESELKQQALEDAWKVAQTLFANQCGTLGLTVDNYTVANWNVDYNAQRFYGKARNYTNSVYEGGPADDEAIELNSGRAVVQVALTVSYVKKN